MGPNPPTLLREFRLRAQLETASQLRRATLWVANPAERIAFDSPLVLTRHLANLQPVRKGGRQDGREEAKMRPILWLILAVAPLLAACRSPVPQDSSWDKGRSDEAQTQATKPTEH